MGKTRSTGTSHGSPRGKQLRAYWAARLPQPCSRCDQLVQPWDVWHVDHVVPRAMGGTDHDTWPAHAKCNMTGGVAPRHLQTMGSSNSPDFSGHSHGLV